jgi:hypothetical protein
MMKWPLLVSLRSARRQLIALDKLLLRHLHHRVQLEHSERESHSHIHTQEHNNRDKHTMLAMQQQPPQPLLLDQRRLLQLTRVSMQNKRRHTDTEFDTLTRHHPMMRR